jgi:hypothetical protein
VLAVACNQNIPTQGGSARADALAARAPLAAWKRRSCRDGVKGPRLYDWALASLPGTGTAEHGLTRWLLIRRNISDPTELAYYLCYGPADTADEELTRVASARWTVEMRHPWCTPSRVGLSSRVVSFLIGGLLRPAGAGVVAGWPVAAFA